MATAEWSTWRGPACFWHLTEAERSERDVAAARGQAEHLAAWNYDPSYLSYPVPDSSQRSKWPEVAIAQWQRHLCAICSMRGGLVGDHDHMTGLLRGYLCTPCNIREGKGWDSRAFKRYRERPPAAVLGIELQCEHPSVLWYRNRVITPEEHRDATDRLTLPPPRRPAADTLEPKS